jgi:dolichyl-phosphate-mannose-protein mannosyltransferase
MGVAPLELQADRTAWLRRLTAAAVTAATSDWTGALAVTVAGGAIRFYRLTTPRSLVSDEFYYVPDAYGILRHGAEVNHRPNAPALILHGSTNILASGGEFVAHPPLGKVMIAAGEWMFGLTPFGWRFAAAVVGTLAILMTARIARRMTGSALLGTIAGLLLAADGLEFVMSRTAMLDIFLMFWTLAAFGCLVLDRDHWRTRLGLQAGDTGSPAGLPGGPAARASTGVQPGEAGAGRGDDDGAGRTQDGTGRSVAGPDRAAAVADSTDVARAGPGTDRAAPRGIRWWRVLAGVCIGLACATKWDALWYIPAFICLAVAWDAAAMAQSGLSQPARRTLLHAVRWVPVSFGLGPAVAYVASYGGWFASTVGYDRNWAALHGNHVPVWSALDSFYHDTRDMLHYGLGLMGAPQSPPWTWLALTRPMTFYDSTTNVCASSHCTTQSTQQILAIGTPLIWWAAIAALVACLAWWLATRDWRAGAVVLCVLAGWLPWIWFAWHGNRIVYFFYAVAFDPFLVLAITLCLGWLIAAGRTRWRRTGRTVTAVYLLAVVADFAFMYPVLTAARLSESAWLARMWLPGWKL